MQVGGQPHPPAASTPGKYAVPILHDAEWAPGPVWTGAENLAPAGIRSQDRPARSQSLYRLSYPAHCVNVKVKICVKFTIQQAMKTQTGSRGVVPLFL